MIIEDLRELIFPIYSVLVTDENRVSLEQKRFMGTAFFVSKEGDALTAAHVIPESDKLEKGHTLVAILMYKGKQQICWINKSLSFAEIDVALIQVNIKPTKILSISAEIINAGEDVTTIGYPSHSVNNCGLEARVLKGYVTLAHKNIELNFAVPAGMSGSPVIINNKVVAISTGRVKSEELIDYYEEELKIDNNKESIKITEVKNVIHYGIAVPLSRFALIPEPHLKNMTLIEFIKKNNEI